MPQDPYRPLDDDARRMTADILQAAPFAALATLTEVGTPTVSRIAFAWIGGQAVTLISTLSDHTKALATSPTCALLLGEPGDKGDPLTHPRLTLHATAEFLDKSVPEYTKFRANWLAVRPKSQLYIDFADFNLVRLIPTGALLNGGFGKAYRLAPDDIC